MCLCEAPVGKQLKILSFSYSQNIIQKLNAMGLHIDSTLVRHNESDWGPILISIGQQDNSKLALGRDLAKFISVEYVQ